MTRADARQVIAACWAILLGLAFVTAGIALNIPADYAVVIALALAGTATRVPHG